MEDNKIYVENQEGVEEEYNILLTFESEEFEKHYVAYFKEGEEELFVSTYNPDDKESGMLGEISSDEEWDMVEEMIEAFLMEDQID